MPQGHPNTGNTKVCTRCRIEKPLADFRAYPRNNTIQVRARCRICDPAARRERYNKYVRPEGDFQIIEGSKRCPICTQTKPSIEFYTIFSRGKFSLLPACKICSSERSKEYVRRNPAAKREANKRGWLKHSYGLSQRQYDTMVSLQNGRCSICSNTLTKSHIDHCHTTGKVRGILCPHCNLGIGHFLDNTRLLDSAITYLESF